ncbi:MAG TPA: hypothetical protein VFR59_07135 [Steroidobacteraceae bacterium]|nr:hypothetical protein [Steroidobacteraceae bacterium]
MSSPQTGAQTALAREVIDPASLRRALAQPQVEARGRRMDELVRLNDLPALTEELRRAIADPQLTEVAREWLIDRALHGLAGGVPSAQARALVEEVSLRQPRVYAIADPEHAREFATGALQASSAVPAIDPGATARFVLRQWARADARGRALDALRAGESWPLDSFGADADESRKAGILDAFATLSDAQLVNLRGPLLLAIGREPAIGEVALLAGERLRDVDLMQAVIAHAQAPIALRGVQRTRTVLDASAAFGVLSDATRRNEVASAAVLELGHLASQEPRALAFLLGSFDRAALAPSAAAALAALKEPSVAVQIGESLRKTRSEPTRRMLALALQLDGGSTARAELARFAASGAGTPQLRKEVREWLAH